MIDVFIGLFVYRLITSIEIVFSTNPGYDVY
jgi:hypothetical protein